MGSDESLPRNTKHTKTAYWFEMSGDVYARLGVAPPFTQDLTWTPGARSEMQSSVGPVECRE